MAAKWSGDEMFYFWVTQFYTMLDKIVTNLKDRYENKESSVIYDMASIICYWWQVSCWPGPGCSESGKVTAYYRMDADQMCSVLQMFNQFKLHIKMNWKALFVSWFYLKRRINVSSKVSSEILNLGSMSSNAQTEYMICLGCLESATRPPPYGEQATNLCCS